MGRIFSGEGEKAVASAEDEKRSQRKVSRRKQNGLRIPADTMHELAIEAARRGIKKWQLADLLFRRGLNLPPRG